MIKAEDRRVAFKLSPQTIQYKKLRPEHFSWAKGYTRHEIIQPDKKTGYVTDILYEKLSKDFENSNTCIVNIGVGRGKTTAAYKIIDYYAKQKKYVVILASPFKKLIQRDYSKLTDMDGGYGVVNYEILEQDKVNIYKLLPNKVHIITINSLMFNPGEDNVEISLKKRAYCNLIQEYCRKYRKKVVFVFDEIHAGIHCFQEEFIFNLRAWKDITHKCFVLSATFTEPARVAIEYIAYLTNYKIYIAETERIKFPAQSNLHLYITDGKYSARDLSLLTPLKGIVEGAEKNKKRVHIVTAFKELAEKLVDPSAKHPLVETIIEKLNPNLVTGETDVEFDYTTSNIGTTFYTGIDLKHKDDILVLIMPSAESKFADKIGGIFTTGKVAISQAIARLRTDGEIHVFMPKSDLCIDGEYLQHVSKEILGEDKKPAVDDEEQFTLLSDFYKTQREPIEKEIVKARHEVNGNHEIWDNRASLNYPSLGSFILNKGMNYLIQRYASFGKGFTPYVLWAALTDQFENTTLKSIYFVRHQTEKLELEKNNIQKGLLDYYGEHLKDLIRGKTFSQSYNALFKLLFYNKRPDAVYGNKVKLYIDGEYFDTIKTPVFVKREIVNILYLVSNKDEPPLNIDADLWVMFQIAKAKDRKKRKLKLGQIGEAFIKLEVTRQKFCSKVIKNNMIANAELFDTEFLYECLDVVRQINKHDKFLRNKTFSFCRLNGAEISEDYKTKLTKQHIKEGGEHIDKLRVKMFHAYKRTFTESKFDKRGEAIVKEIYDLDLIDKHFYPDIFK